MKARLLTMVWLSVICTELYGQYSFASLEDLWKFAEGRNIQVHAAQTQHEIAKAGVRQARSNFLPGIGISGTFTDNITIQPTLVPSELVGGVPGTFVEQEFGRRYNYTAGFSAQVDLINVNNWFSVRGAHIETSITAVSSQLTIESLYKATASAYFNYYLMHESERLAQESLKTSEVLMKHARNLYQLGQISEVTLNTTSIYVKQASLILLNANYSKQQALNQLKQWLELSVSDSLILSEEWPVYSIGENDIVDFNFPPDLELKLSQMQSAASQNAWQAAKAAYLPTLTAAYNFNTLITGNEFLNFNNTNNLPQQYWGLKLTVPLLSNGTRNFKLSKTRLEYDAARKRHESIAQETTLIDNNLITHYTAAREKLQSSSEILELYHNNDTHADLQFEAGQISMDTRLRVYQDYLSYKQEYLRNLADLYTRYAELKVRQQQL